MTSQSSILKFILGNQWIYEAYLQIINMGSLLGVGVTQKHPFTQYEDIL